MRPGSKIRLLFFIVFFSIGITAMTLSILCNDLLAYYRNRQLLKAEQQRLERLKSLNSDYEALLEQLKEDQNLMKRIAPATLGISPDTQDTVYPATEVERLVNAKKVLDEELSKQKDQPMIPHWLNRCSRQPRRSVLFLASAFLILISFTCFGPQREST